MQVTAADYERMAGSLANSDVSLPEKYRILITLKNIGGKDAINAMISGTKPMTDPPAFLH